MFIQPVTATLCILMLLPHTGQAAYTAVTSASETLTDRATVTSPHVCHDVVTCPSLNETTCASDQLCTQVITCNGREDLPQKYLPLNQWDRQKNTAGCDLTAQHSITAPSAGIFMAHSSEMLVVNESSVSPCFVEWNSSSDDVFTLVFWIHASCSNW